MFQSFVQKFITGQIGQQSLSEAAAEQVNTMPGDEVAKHVSIAAQNATQNDKPEIAQQLMEIAKNSADPQQLKQGLISLISSNPQILQYFEGEFAQPIMTKL